MNKYPQLLEKLYHSMQSKTKIKKKVLTWINTLVFSIFVFIVGFYCAYKLTFEQDLLIVGAQDHHLRNKSYFDALDGYISVSNRYMAQYSSDYMRLYKAFNKPNGSGLDAEIKIGPYQGGKKLAAWLKGNEQVNVKLISDEIIHDRIRRVIAEETVVGNDLVLEVILFIKGKNQIRIHGVDIYQFSEELISGYREYPWSNSD